MRQTTSISFKAAMMMVILISIISSCEDEENNGPEPEGIGFEINNNSGPSKGPCGEFKWKVNHELDEATDSGGYFVQKLRIHKNITKECPSTGCNNIDVTYYEAWKVNQDCTVTKYREGDRGDYDDMYKSPSCLDSEGTNDFTGELKYFENLSLPGDFKKNNPKTYAGVLPSTTNKPDFWDNGESLTHNLSSEWDCCGDSTHTLTTTPDFTEEEEEESETTGGKFFDHVEPLTPWSDRSYTEADNNLLRENAQQLQRLSTTEIMNGIEEYSTYYKGETDALSKLYIMMRILFDVPEFTPMDQAQSFGGWIKPEQLITGEQTSLLWPLGFDEGPIPVVKHDFMGYAGTSYNAVDEAQYFMEQFGRREF
ncbi:MAG: hypothetical protein K9I68_11565 [Bacteroidales bacterium]|nr:hypothetical protein [Bacteroidales bacterium]MCF8339171.1 hypothetical protein [Bacteroidales bacterium]